MSTPQWSALHLHLAEAVKRRRAELGLSLEQVARRTGGALTRAALSHIEHRRNLPGLETLVALAEALEVSPAALLPPRNFSEKTV